MSNYELYALGDIVTERNEPHPMTGEVVTIRSVQGARVDYGVRFSVTADTITYVNAADIKLAHGVSPLCQRFVRTYFAGGDAA